MTQFRQFTNYAAKGNQVTVAASATNQSNTFQGKADAGKISGVEIYVTSNTPADYSSGLLTLLADNQLVFENVPAFMFGAAIDNQRRYFRLNGVKNDAQFTLLSTNGSANAWGVNVVLKYNEY